MIDLAIRLDPLIALRPGDPPCAPEPAVLAAAAVAGGADRLVVRLRSAREPVRDRDVRMLRETASVGLEIEVSADLALVDPILETRPERVTFVGRRAPIDPTKPNPDLSEAADALITAEIPFGIEIAPDTEHVLAVQDLGARFVRIDTGAFARAMTEDRAVMGFRQIDSASRAASEIGLRVTVGSGLGSRTSRRLVGLSAVEQIVVGSAVAARAVFVGLETAVRELRTALREPQVGGGGDT